MGSFPVRKTGAHQPVPRAIWLLGGACFLNVGGLSLLWPVNAIYIHSQLHQSMTVAGLVLMVYSGCGFIGSFVAGWLYDRVGYLPVLLGAILLSTGVVIIPALFTGWWLYIAVLAVFGASCAMPFPVFNALAGHTWPQGGRRAFNFLYVSTNLGVAFGTAVGGVLATWSFRGVFIGIAAAYLALIALVWTTLRPTLSQFNQAVHEPTAGAGSDRSRGLSFVEDELPPAAPVAASELPRVPWVPVGVLFLSFILCWTIYVQWQSTISVYMQALGDPLTSYSLLWTMNGVLIFCGQPLVAWVVRRVSALWKQMVGGVLLYAVAYTMLSMNAHYGAFVVAMVITTLGEMFVWPAVPAAVAQLAPSHRMGLLQGMTNGCATLGRMVGPLAGGWLYDQAGVHQLLVVFTVACSLPVLGYLVYGRLTKVSASGLFTRSTEW